MAAQVSCRELSETVWTPWIERGQPLEQREDAILQVANQWTRECEQLTLSGLALKELPPGLEHLHSMRQLYASENALPHLRDVRPCRSVQSLSLSDNPLQSLDGIGTAFPNLRELFISRTQVSSLRPLAQCPSLNALFCAGTPVRDWEGIQRLPLRELCVADLRDPREERFLSPEQIKAMQVCL